MTRVNNLGHASRSRGPGPKKSNNNTSQPNNNSIGVIRGRVNQLIDQLTDNTNKGLNEDPTAKTLSFGEEDKSIANLTYTSMADGEEDGGRNKPGRPPRDPISKRPQDQLTTFRDGEEGDNRFIYSQYTRLNIYQPQSFTS